MSWEIRSLQISGFASNCYWLENGHDAWIIDPAAYPEKRPHTDSVLRGILVTHGHMDHILTADDWRQKIDVPLYIHEADAHMLTDSMANVSALFGRPMSWKPADKLLKNHDKVELGGGSYIKVIHTPGHTAGGVCFMLYDQNNYPKAIFTGDTLFADSIGRTDIGGSDEDMAESLKLIGSWLNDQTENIITYPGHGPSERFGRLCRNHPWLKI